MENQVILKVTDITKTYPGVKALDDISLEVYKGEIHGLVGENGAGKSTLIKILSGAVMATSGSFAIMGKEAKFSSPAEALTRGIGVVHQELKLIESLSVSENIFLGRPITSGLLNLVNSKRQIQLSDDLLKKLNANFSSNILVENLSVAQKQLVEIAKALSLNAEIIIMDEPSATLTDKELDVLFSILKGLRKRGTTIIYISHRLEEIFKLANRVTVMRDGKIINTLPIEELNHKKLIEMMVGRAMEQEFPHRNSQIGAPVLKLENFSRKGAFENINFTLHKGEILGIAGLVGAGRTELVRAIFGVGQKTSGRTEVFGKIVDIKDVTIAIHNRIGLVPEERKSQGLILGMSVKQNISLVGLDLIKKRCVINDSLETSLSQKYIDALRIVTPSGNQEVQNLSGGNQQKVVLAKWLAVDSNILLFDEPTRGIDVGAKAEIYLLLSDLVTQGKGIILVSSELPELIGMCDRILVMSEGHITGEISGQDATQELIMEHATGIKQRRKNV